MYLLTKIEELLTVRTVASFKLKPSKGRSRMNNHMNEDCETYLLTYTE